MPRSGFEAAPAALCRRQPSGDQLGYAEFRDGACADHARRLYNGWAGWGGRGLSVAVSEFSIAQVAPSLAQAGAGAAPQLLDPNPSSPHFGLGQKRPREELPGEQ